jgi:peroxiredoxin/tetratricopeptide (TPR) repeat protein
MSKPSAIASVALVFLVWPLWADTPAPGDPPRPGHSHEGEVFNEGPRQFAIPIDGTGDVHFPIESTWPEAQAWFNQGIGQLHGFWYFEAERTFRHIAAHDPECAMAYWGMAMANWENPQRARGFIEKAVALKDQAGEGGRMWIEACRAHFDAGGDAATKHRKLVRDLEAIIHANPDDIEAKAFLACRIWQMSRMGLPIHSHESVDALLRQVLERAPNHPAHHYVIHLWDEEKAARALDSAAKLAATAPAIAHMWHMPAHIYSRLGRYDDAAWHQEASARVDHRQLLEQRVLPDQIHNYAHNGEWLVRNLLALGNGRRALEVCKSLLANPRHPTLNSPSNFRSSVAYGRPRLIEILEQFELWDEAIALSRTGYFDDSGSDQDRLARMRILAIAHFETVNLAAFEGVRAEIARHLSDEETDAEATRAQAREKALEQKKDGPELEKAIANAARPHRDRIAKLQEVAAELEVYAALLDNRIDDPREALGAVRRPKFSLARLNLRLGRNEEALNLSKEAVDGSPGYTLPLAARVGILHACGDVAAAREVFVKLKEISSNVDLSAPAFQRLESIAREFGEPADWRTPPVLRDDIGKRPDLDSLGPRDWTPPPAPSFDLPDGAGGSFSLSRIQGKPVVVLFYLGHGCLHCIEQLNVFAPMYSTFLDAGIELMAISADQADELQKSRLAYSEGGAFPFQILADPSMHAFKTWRAYDDFEDKPLHGTFLIDGKGRILWQDIGAEPFQDPDFLIKEATRLLEIHRN